MLTCVSLKMMPAVLAANDPPRAEIVPDAFSPAVFVMVLPSVEELPHLKVLWSLPEPVTPVPVQVMSTWNGGCRPGPPPPANGVTPAALPVTGAPVLHISSAVKFVCSEALFRSLLTLKSDWLFRTKQKNPLPFTPNTCSWTRVELLMTGSFWLFPWSGSTEFKPWLTKTSKPVVWLGSLGNPNWAAAVVFTKR